jgi:hypothetical protein
MRWFAKKIFDGGGKRLKNHLNSICYLNNILKKLKCFTKKLSTFLTPRHEEKLLNSKGIILIEFAVCMPILIILLFYINDLVRIKRYYSQTEFVGQQMANMIQNISQQRASKSITQDDLKYALCLANLSMFPGTTMYTQDTNYPGYTTWVQMYRVVGAGNGKAKCTHRWELSAWNGKKPPKSIWYTCTSGDHNGSKVRYSSTAVTPSQIYPTLKMGSDDNTTEEKIIIDVCIFTDSKIRPMGKSTEKQIFGLNLVTPPFRLYKTNQFHFYCHSIVIFSPKKGLFSDSCPPAS